MTAEFDLLVNGSLWPAVHSYVTTTFNGWFYGIILIVLLSVLFIKTRSGVLTATIATFAVGILTGYNLLNQPTMIAVYAMLAIFWAAVLYAVINKN